jgi:hypothetical protein
MLATRLLRAGVAPQRVVGRVGARSFAGSVTLNGGGRVHGGGGVTARQACGLLRASLLAREPAAVCLIHTQATAVSEGGAASRFYRGHHHLSSLWGPLLRVRGRRAFSQQGKKGSSSSENAATGGAAPSATKAGICAGPVAEVATASESGNQAATAWYRTSFAKHVVIVGGVVGAASFIACVRACSLSGRAFAAARACPVGQSRCVVNFFFAG